MMCERTAHYCKLSVQDSVHRYPHHCPARALQQLSLLRVRLTSIRHGKYGLKEQEHISNLSFDMNIGDRASLSAIERLHTSPGDTAVVMD